jgi:TolB-like protein
LFWREQPADQNLSLGRGVATPDSSGSREQQTPTGKAYSLAILPFRNLSGDPQADFYAMSLADSLITELASAKSIAVMPSSMVARYQNQSINPVQVLADLKADAILVGNFLKAGDRLRVTTQLVNASGEIVWSEKIDGDATDVLAIQDRITERTIAGLAGGRVSIDPTQLLKDESEEIRLDAVRTLKFSHDPRALSALIEAVRDPSLRVKSEAVQALVMLGHEATGPVIALLNDAMDEGEHLTARFAAKALGLIGDRSITPVLIELLGSDDKFVVCEAILSAGRLGDMTVVPELIARLEDPNGNVRFAAAEALGHLCDPAARESLQQRLNDEDEGVRAKARWALSRLRIADRKSRPDPEFMRGAVSS